MLLNLFLNQDINVRALTSGHKKTWDQFVERYSSVIYAAVKRTINNPTGEQNIDDVVQEVFLKLCQNNYKLLKNYNPKKSSIGTWLTIIARTTAIDAVRKKQIQKVPLDDMEPTSVGGPQYPTEFTLPKHLLSARQSLVLTLLYEREMNVDEIAHILDIKQQTVCSTHHKALQKLKSHFNNKNGDELQLKRV